MAKTQYRLNHLQPDTEYAFQLRAKVEGVLGAWSPVFRFDTGLDDVAPGPVTNLELTFENGTFLLTWDAPVVDENGGSLDDLRYYRVEVENLGESVSGVEAIHSFTVNETRLEFTQQLSRYLFKKQVGEIRFTVYALDNAGNESTGVSVEFIAQPPAPFSMLEANPASLGVELLWQESSYGENDIGITYYEIYRDDVLVGRTVQDETSYFDGNPGAGVHTYYVIAYNLFGLSTRSLNSLDAAPLGYWQGDDTVPGPVLGLTADSVISSNDGGRADVTLQWSPPESNTDGSDYEDESVFRIQHSQNSNGPWVRNEIADDGDPASFVIAELQSSTRYYFRVAAVDRYTNVGVYTTVVHTTVQDEVSPAIPAAPTAAGGALTVQVSHSLRDIDDELLDEDLAELRVYISDDPAFPSPENDYVGSMSTSRPSDGVRPLSSFPVPNKEHRYVRVVAVDTTGNRSPFSPIADADDITLIDTIHIEEASITTALVDSLEASVLKSNSAFTTSLFVRNILTVDEQGQIVSDNFVPEVSGYSLGPAGLEINDGIVSAKAVAINNSPNLLPWAYATFGNRSLWYLGGTDQEDSEGAKIASSQNSTVTFSSVYSWVGGQSMRWRTAGVTTSSAKARVMLWDGNTNIDVQEGERYIVSLYGRTVRDESIEMALRWSGGALPISNDKTVVVKSENGFFRVFAIFEAPPGSTGAALRLSTSSPGMEMFVDGIQVEKVTSSLADSLIVPSAWKAPAHTTIDGGVISTGSIRSNSYQSGSSESGGQGWRIGFEGTATLNQAFVRGEIVAESGYLGSMTVYKTLIVGGQSPDGASNSGLIRDVNNKWSLDGDGKLRAVDAEIQGKITATSGTLDSMNAIEVVVGPVTGSNLGHIRSASIPSNALRTRSVQLNGNTPGWIVSNDSNISLTGVDNNNSFNAYFNNVYFSGTIQASNILGNTIRGGSILGVQFITNPSTTEGSLRINSSGGVTFRNGDGATQGRIYVPGGNNGLVIQAHTGVGKLRLEASAGIFVESPIRLAGGADLNGGNISGVSQIGTNRLASNGATHILFQSPIENLTLFSNMNANDKTISNINNIVGGTTDSRLERFNHVRAGTFTVTDGGNSTTARAYVGMLSSDLFIRDVGSGKAGLRFFGDQVRVISNSGNSTSWRTIRGIVINESSQNSKHSIARADLNLDQIERIEVMEFEYNDVPGLRVGVISEQIGSVDPRFAQGSGVDAAGLAAIAIEGVKLLREENRRLSKRLEALEATR